MKSFLHHFFFLFSYSFTKQNNIQMAPQKRIHQIAKRRRPFGRFPLIQGLCLFEKRVSFHPSAKWYDGLNRKTGPFNEFMRYVLERTENNIVHTLAKKRSWFGLQRLLNKLEDLIARCEESTKGYALILPEGGRNSAGIITRDQLPFLREKALPYVKSMIREVRKANYSQKPAYSKAKQRKFLSCSFRAKTVRQLF